MTLQQLINQHRAALLAREQAASADMARYYNTIWQRAYARLDELLGKMRDAIDNGADIKVSWLYEANRLAGTSESLLPQIAQQFDLFAQQAEMTTRNLALSGFQLGVQDAQALLQRAFSNAPPGFDATFNQLPRQAISEVVGSFQDGSPVSALFDSFGTEAAQTVKNSLVSGVALGKAPALIARDVQQALSIPLSRALVIARDQTIKAYRGASLDTYRANNDVVDGWIWSADIGSLRICAVCAFMNGSEHSLDEDFDSHTQCRCSPVPKTKSWSDLGFDGIEDTPLNIQNGEEWFANLNASDQDAILGKAAGAAYRRGDVSLGDFVGVKDDPTWGKSRYQKSLKEALA